MPYKIAAIHDISCFGRCSMQIVWPVLSHFGNMVCPLPTALLSTHTGGYENFTFLDLSEEMNKITNSWETENIFFDAVYSGFLGNENQIQTIRELIKRNNNALILIDPVMGDNGKIYKTYNRRMCDGMKSLCADADIITPNLTEAYILTDREYNPNPEISELENLAAELSRLITKPEKTVIISGIRDGDQIGAMYYKTRPNAKPESGFAMAKYCDRFFPGCGDILASILLGKLLNGGDILQALKFAVEFISEVSEKTKLSGTDPREGIILEPELHKINI